MKQIFAGSTVRIAKASFTPAQVVENVLSAINAIVAQVYRRSNWYETS
jgi:hypothetical protein